MHRHHLRLVDHWAASHHAVLAEMLASVEDSRSGRRALSAVLSEATGTLGLLERRRHRALHLLVPRELCSCVALHGLVGNVLLTVEAGLSARHHGVDRNASDQTCSKLLIHVQHLPKLRVETPASSFVVHRVVSSVVATHDDADVTVRYVQRISEVVVPWLRVAEFNPSALAAAAAAESDVPSFPQDAAYTAGSTEFLVNLLSGDS